MGWFGNDKNEELIAMRSDISSLTSGARVISDHIVKLTHIVASIGLNDRNKALAVFCKNTIELIEASPAFELIIPPYSKKPIVKVAKKVSKKK